MRTSVLLVSAICIPFLVGALLARTALFLHVSTRAVPLENSTPDPAPQYSLARIAALARAVDIRDQLVLVDASDPYGGTAKMQTQIAYSSSTEFVDPRTGAIVPFTDAIAQTFAPGTELYIWVSRDGGALTAQRILE